jgi:hypothetical protein
MRDVKLLTITEDQKKKLNLNDSKKWAELDKKELVALKERKQILKRSGLDLQEVKKQ